MKNVKNNGLFIECYSKSECEKLQHNINNNFSDICEAKLPKTLNPRQVIYNIYNENNEKLENIENELKQVIIKQNDSIKHCLENKTIEN
jgi:hypothetical protein